MGQVKNTSQSVSIGTTEEKRVVQSSNIGQRIQQNLVHDVDPSKEVELFLAKIGMER